MEEQKNPAGRPPLFNTPEEMQQKIDAYFEKCDNATEWVVSKGEAIEIKSPDPYTIEGLCVELGMTRQSLLNYEKTDPFFDTISRAKLKVLSSVATGAIKGRFNAHASNFNMKNNFGYRDQQEQIISDHRIDVEIVNSK